MNTTTHETVVSLLILSSDNSIYTKLCETFESKSWQLHTAMSVTDAEQVMNNNDIALAFVHESAANLPDTVSKLRYINPFLEIIFIPSSDESLELLPYSKLRLFDILDNDFSKPQLLVKTDNALRLRKASGELTYLKQQVAMNYGFDNIVGDSKAILKVKETLRRIADTDITVMLSGNNGVGKNLTARVIHHHSTRREQPFVVVECASIPENLFEQELFGETDQSTGDATRTGLLEQADNGTLFLNDVDKLPASIQPMLLEFMFDQTLKNRSKKLNLRIIAATSTDIKTLVQRQQYTESLYYQLNVLPIHLPDLCKRAEDIEPLANYFCRKAAYEMERNYISLSGNALEKLLQYDWPGNIRELENTVKRAVALTPGNMIEANQIIFINKPNEMAVSAAEQIDGSDSQNLEEGQRKLILKALHKNRWNFTHTANELGIGRTTLWRKVKKFNLTQETA